MNCRSRFLFRGRFLSYLVPRAKFGQAVLFGKPLLPVNGKVYWKNKNAIIPAGYNFDLHMLTDILLIKINPEKNCWILWDTDSSFIKIEKHLLEPLSISSFRKTYNQLQK